MGVKIEWEEKNFFILAYLLVAVLYTNTPQILIFFTDNSISFHSSKERKKILLN